MTIAEFDEMIMQMARDRTGLERNCSYLRQQKRRDKYLREEYIAVQAVVKYKRYLATEEIELGDEKQGWDARIASRDILEVVQALPSDEHKVREAITTGEAKIMLPVDDPEGDEPDDLPLTGPGALFLLQAQHARDHLQFPKAIIDSIEKKHRKKYADVRTLIVVFDGDYSFEDDRTVLGWIADIRRHTTRGAFAAIYIVERDRRKVFPVFE